MCVFFGIRQVASLAVSIMIDESFACVVCSVDSFLGCCMFRRITFLDIVAFGDSHI